MGQAEEAALVEKEPGRGDVMEANREFKKEELINEAL